MNDPIYVGKVKKFTGCYPRSDRVELELDYIRTLMACNKCGKVKGGIDPKDFPLNVLIEYIRRDASSIAMEMDKIKCLNCNPEKNVHSLSDAELPEAKRRNVQTEVPTFVNNGTQTDIPKATIRSGVEICRSNKCGLEYNHSVEVCTTLHPFRQSQSINQEISENPMACAHCNSHNILYSSHSGYSCMHCNHPF